MIAHLITNTFLNTASTKSLYVALLTNHVENRKYYKHSHLLNNLKVLKIARQLDLFQNYTQNIINFLRKYKLKHICAYVYRLQDVDNNQTILCRYLKRTPNSIR